MKVIFLDIDGVLNSEEYYESFPDGEFIPPIDPVCVERLKRIVDRTGAKLILSSSWRGGWEKKREDTWEYTLFLVDALAEFGLEIEDKTIYLDGDAREAEVRHWLMHAPERIDGYVILDDYDYNWKKKGLDRRWVRTDFEEGGLLDSDVDRAVRLLEKKPGFLDRLRWHVYK